MEQIYTLDNLDDAKDALKDMQKVFREKIKAGELKNEGFNDGYSQQYSFGGVTLVRVFDDSKNRVINDVFYNGNEEIANIEFDGYTSLDSEFEEDINNVLVAYDDFKDAVKIENSLKAKREDMSEMVSKPKSLKR